MASLGGAGERGSVGAGDEENEEKSVTLSLSKHDGQRVSRLALSLRADKCPASSVIS